MKLGKSITPLLLLALSLTAASCGGGRERAPAPRAAQPRTPAPGVVTPASAEEVLAVVCQPGARVAVLNVWGTWCVPCREEFPDLVRLRRNYADRGLRLVFYSVDFDTELPQVHRFLDSQGVDFDTYIRHGGDDNGFINALSPRWSGALPATFVYDAAGRLQDFWEGKASYAQMEARMLRVLNGPAHSDSMEVRS